MQAQTFIEIYGQTEAQNIIDTRDKWHPRCGVYKFNADYNGAGSFLYGESFGEYAVNINELKNLISSKS